MHPPLAMSCYRRTPRSEGLPKDLPDYLIYVTREALVAATTSLGKASAETHDALLRVNQMLAYERMMRSVFLMGAPAMASWPMNAVPPLALPNPAASKSSAAVTKPAQGDERGPKDQMSKQSAADLASVAGVASGATALNATMALAALFLKFAPVMAAGHSLT